MKNTITASIEFYFKGEHYRPSIILDLDILIACHGTLPEICPLLAKQNGIDHYSYEYEMMLAEEVIFSSPQGDAKGFFTNGVFDEPGFVQHYRPSIILDLDVLIACHGTLPEICPLLAKQNGIDHYSYEYEMMLAEEVIFSSPQGDAKGFFTNGVFDEPGFVQHWQEIRERAIIKEIAQRHLAVNNLIEQPALKAALIDAYREGVKTNP